MKQGKIVTLAPRDVAFWFFGPRSFPDYVRQSQKNPRMRCPVFTAAPVRKAQHVPRTAHR